MGDAKVMSNAPVDKGVGEVGNTCTQVTTAWGHRGDAQNSSRRIPYGRHELPFPGLWIKDKLPSRYPRCVTNTYRITVICLGNICRSPIGEAVLRDRIAGAGLAGRFSVDSAGTGDWHVGQGANIKSIATLTQHGYTLDHTARQITQTWFDNIDLALVMDTNNYTDVKSLIELSGAAVELHMMRAFDPMLRDIVEPDPALDVPDPYHGTIDDFATVLQMIEAASDGLVSKLALQVP